MIAMKIDTKIILFKKIETLITLLFITILVTSFILLLFFNIFYLSDFIRMGIFLFICIIFIVGSLVGGLLGYYGSELFMD